MKYLVTGGAGFVGSHLAQALVDAGHDVVVLDNLSTGHRAAVPEGARFVHADLSDADVTDRAVAAGVWDAVLHFAAVSLVAESMREPFLYLRRNFITSLNLIEACARHGVKRFVFPSTAALFGGEGQLPRIPAEARIEPGSPYGESKYLIERALVWADRICGMKSACLRYFNAAGADALGRLGEDHRPETHLIPLTIDAALGRRPGLKLFGNDYPTRDGTCVRDYVHVSDLADAHIRVMSQLDERSVTYNLGNGVGFSNLEVIQSVERVSGRKVPWEWAPRRGGDPAVLVADSLEICRETGWSPRFSRLDDIVETALRWRVDHPNGYGSC
ncbi:UDP-glucose 4-epimerase GalE [Gluconobacter kanchanaburiensis]|uniref:UDP-glucose 4-epimerase n=1 Tax=Gluconobacter kanchanaburiensis NBRC 103587 TaxID=1307948 RepID=A0A511B518_9PROT|nr:UDP-glucose 4-epimerase GalE [Gluconobacter kanchanaburiensis]MBF0861934.1 UDP-glucose 4-epimerase GalE [Gluconobacter kanchanaburiensis]GBR67776.1 UDP-glucose 4-epimerase [Gluconobacter kanchanaburiensis NBRC 103587]GEK95540.1 UDP-glucose 4-epimerase [Gluconobacter kanchanaburiensis NBRC 103587]